jgi:ferredoxin
MADSELKWPDNVKGRFFVDQHCIDCDLCRTTAPSNFERSGDGYSFVAKQPTSDFEKKACEQAMRECPVEAIGDAQTAPAPST